MNDFLKFWTVCCFLYTAKLMYLMTDTVFKYDFNMPIIFNMLCLYIALFTFQAWCKIDNILYGRFWFNYSVLLTALGLILSFCNVTLAVIAFPFMLYECIILCSASVIFLRKWTFSWRVKGISCILFLLVGMQDIYSMLTVSFQGQTPMMMLLSFCSLLILNFLFTYLFQKTIHRNKFIKNDSLFVLAEHAVDILFSYTLQPSPRFSFISPSVESIVGYKVNDFYKNPKLHIELTHEQDRDVILRAFSEEATSVNKNYIRWQRRDGEYIYLEFHNAPIFSGEKLIGIEGILRDITDRKLVEQEMLDSKKSKQILLSYISHELKTPITYIVGYAEALKENIYQTEVERKNAIELIESKAVFLQKLVEDLFQLSKMESNQFSFEFMQTTVKELYDLLNDKHKNDFLNSKLSYTFQLDDKLYDEKYEVLVDQKRIEQVFANLLQNAIKHTPNHGQISCHCLLNEKKNVVAFKVCDTGEGIPKEEMPYVFNRFYRGKSISHKSKEGSGLGLSLSRQIVMAHKGTIEVESNKGEGCTFQFTIPLYAEES